jgi:2-polyprenyl-3-methyl-5-hydroxy-6-metoxy-1,4-benzoquinol methylase
MSPQNQPDQSSDDPAERLAQAIARRRAQPMPTEAPAQVTFPVRQADIADTADIADPAAPASRENSMRERLRLILGPGHSLKARVRALPLLGRFAVWLRAVVHLNTIRKEFERDIAVLRNRLDHYDAMNIENRLARLEALDVAYRLNRLDALDIGDRLHAFDAINIANRLNRLEESAEEEEQRDRERDNRIAQLTRQSHDRHAPQRSAESSAPTVQATEAQTAQAGYDFGADRFYTEFEGHFRGAREDIRERQKIYLPYLEHVAAGSDARVLDIGCGRGEWLELMKMQGIRATGIDLNGEMVATCREHGLDAEHADAVAWLRGQPEGSLAAVTGFHIIEHLPFDQLIALFDAALHALRPDGVIIFETPNPENVSVGSCSFYYDPTHRHPIAPAVAEFIARQRGFARAEIVRANPLPGTRLIAENTEVAHRFNSAFYGPQDYAVIAWKTYAS